MLRISVKKLHHSTRTHWEFLCKFPKFAKKVSAESIKLLQHPEVITDCLSGGNAIISYDKPFDKETNVDKCLNLWANIGTIACIHTVQDGPLKAERVALTAYNVLRDSKYLYSWNGKRALIGDANGGVKVINVWQQTLFGNVVCYDEIHDIAAIK